jgi:hypothetical protein
MIQAAFCQTLSMSELKVGKEGGREGGRERRGGGTQGLIHVDINTMYAISHSVGNINVIVMMGNGARIDHRKAAPRAPVPWGGGEGRGGAQVAAGREGGREGGRKGGREGGVLGPGTDCLHGREREGAPRGRKGGTEGGREGRRA